MAICELLSTVCKSKQETAITHLMFIYCTCFSEVKFPIHVLVRFTNCFSLGPFNQNLSTAHSTNVIRPEFNVYVSVHRTNILIYIQQDATLHSLFYLETALHVSGGTTTHHQENK